MFGSASRSNPSALERVHADLDRPLLRVVASSGERRRRYATCAGRRRSPRAPGRATARTSARAALVAAAAASARRGQRALELAERDRLLLLVAGDGSALARELRLELVAGAQELAAAASLKPPRARRPERAELVALARTPAATASRACAVRSGSSSPLNSTRAARIAFSSSSSRAASSAETMPALARLAQPVEPLPLVAAGGPPRPRAARRAGHA